MPRSKQRLEEACDELGEPPESVICSLLRRCTSGDCEE